MKTIKVTDVNLEDVYSMLYGVNTFNEVGLSVISKEKSLNCDNTLNNINITVYLIIYQSKCVWPRVLCTKSRFYYNTIFST